MGMTKREQTSMPTDARTTDLSEALPESSERGAVEGDQCQELMEQRASQQRGHLAVVVLGLNLNQVKADQVEASEATDKLERIAATWSPDFGRAGPRREARVDEINVKAQKDRTIADPLDDLGHHVIDSSLH